eukprot:TRINITY_DN1445_c0_g1_i3.p1 TRINITY_DN1445_c0_g1~~TRINITY_DN1445_c0_g1_i3.p1  ORF type:complete len:316 (-),score=68.15 TRINITY_DN1445_c0_g1_i3:13-960(-)
MGEINAGGQVVDLIDQILGYVNECTGEIIKGNETLLVQVNASGETVDAQHSFRGMFHPFTFHLLPIVAQYIFHFDRAFAQNGKFSLVTRLTPEELKKQTDYISIDKFNIDDISWDDTSEEYKPNHELPPVLPDIADELQEYNIIDPELKTRTSVPQVDVLNYEEPISDTANLMNYTLSAHEIAILDADSNLRAFIDIRNGQVLRANREVVGQIVDNEIIKEDDTLLGEINNLGKLFNPYGSLVAMVDTPSGELSTSKKQLLASIKARNIVNVHGEKVGTLVGNATEDIVRLALTYIYYFDMGLVRKKAFSLVVNK